MLAYFFYLFVGVTHLSMWQTGLKMNNWCLLGACFTFDVATLMIRDTVLSHTLVADVMTTKQHQYVPLDLLAGKAADVLI